MSDPIKIDVGSLAAEVAWIAKTKSPLGTSVLHTAELSILVGACSLRRTDYEQFRESVIPAEGGGQARVLVDPAKLGSLLKSATGNATLEITDTGLTIGCGGRTIRLRGAGDVAEFPDWPVFEAGADVAVLGSGQVARALTSVGTDDTLPMLTGVRFDGGVMASTDRFRLSCITYDSHGFDALVPGAVLRAFASGDTVVNVEPGTVGADAKWVRISSGGRSVLARQLDCEFPKYRQLIPTELPVQAMIRRDELLGAIGDSEHVTLTLRHDDTMLVCAASRDGDMEVEQEISAPLLGDGELPFTVRLNSKNLAGCLKGTSAGVLKFAATTSSRPVVLTGAGDGDLHLVMPVRIAG